MMYNMAVILSCFNRRENSIKCVKSIINAAVNVPELSLFFYIWDDGSTDGTADALEETDKRIRVYRGPGDYYWSKSMHEAMIEAVKNDHDIYLMVNDDAVFFENSLSILIDSYKTAGEECGIVGSMMYDGEITYGGRKRDYSYIEPGRELKRCVYANWNCFMVDRCVISDVGLICEKYRHAGGDFDYSCRMNRKGIPQYVATDFVGECEIDHPVPGYFNSDMGVLARLRYLFSPKGSPIASFFRLHWVDKRFKGVIIATYHYAMLILRVIFLRKNN